MLISGVTYRYMYIKYYEINLGEFEYRVKKKVVSLVMKNKLKPGLSNRFGMGHPTRLVIEGMHAIDSKLIISPNNGDNNMKIFPRAKLALGGRWQPMH